MTFQPGARSAREAAARRRLWAGLAALAAGWAAVLFAAFRPGLMSVDSLVQYGQGLEGRFSNQHPPFGSWLFGLSGRWFGTPAGLLVLQLAALGGGTALLAGQARPGRRALAFALAALLLVLPSTWAVAVVLWKDVVLGGVLLLACAALRARRPVLALALLLPATLLRHNALLATVPLAAAALGGIPALAPARIRAVALAALAAAGVGALVAVDRLSHAQDVWPLGQVLVYDVAGTYLRHPDAWGRSPFARELPASELPRLYTPASGGLILFPRKKGDPGVDFHTLAARRDVIRRAWLDAVTSYPGDYLLHRWNVFLELLSAHRRHVDYPFETDLDPNPWGLRLAADHGAAYRALTALRDRSKDALLFRGWAWLALAALGAGAGALRFRSDPLPFWIALSGVAYALGYLPTGVSSDFRYLYWTMLSTGAAALAALAASPARRGPTEILG